MSTVETDSSLEPSARPSRRARFSRWLPGLGLVALVLLIWEGAAKTGLIQPFLFPAPSTVLETLGLLWSDGFPPGLTIWDHVSATILRVLQGYVLAALVALPLGLVIGPLDFVRSATVPLVTFFRSIAVISLLPLSLAFFGAGESARVALIAYAAFWIILTNTMEAAQRIPAPLIRAARSLGASGFSLYMQVMMPAALPKIFSGLKVALGLAWVVIVAVELIGTELGVGALISNAQRLYRTDIVIAGMVIIGIIGMGLALGLDWLEAKLLPWVHERSEEGAKR